jgi:hypothetical protein
LPFTLSHPAAIALLWPLARRARLPLAALAIGAMSPDFEFFLHLRPLALWSHTATGLIGFCLPAGLAVFAAWDLVAREPLRDLLGYAAEPPQQSRGWDTWIRAAIAVLVGAATHLLWDGLTHGDYWGARIWPGLRTTALTVGTLSVPWFNLLQHLSTVVGGLVVIGWSIADVRAHGDVHVVLRSGWRRRAIVMIAIATVCAGLMNGARGPFGADFWTAQRLLGRIAVGAMLGGAVAVLGIALRHRARAASP